MLTAFLITTLIIFSINLMMNILVLGFNLSSDGPVPIISIVNIVVNLLMITWNIFVLVNN